MKLEINDNIFKYSYNEENIEIKRETIKNKFNDKFYRIINNINYVKDVYNMKKYKNNEPILYKDIIEMAKKGYTNKLIINKVGIEHVKNYMNITNLSFEEKMKIYEDEDFTKILGSLEKIHELLDSEEYKEKVESITNQFNELSKLLDKIIFKDGKVIIKDEQNFQIFNKYKIDNMRKYFKYIRKELKILYKDISSQNKSVIDKENEKKLGIIYFNLLIELFKVRNYRDGYAIIKFNNEIHKVIFSNNNELEIENILGRNDELKWLEEQLLYSENCSVLVSGYRGAGKSAAISSLINKINYEKKVRYGSNNKKYKNHLFIKLNINEHMEYTTMLRAIIREIYWELSKNIKYNEIKKKYPRFVKKVSLLYEKTFYEIKNISKDKKNKEYNFDPSAIIDIIILIAIVMGFIKFNPNEEIQIYLKAVATITSIFTIIKIGRLGILGKYKNEKLDEVERSSLYDDEIAEFQLKDILFKFKNLQDNKTKIIFIIDEMDKLNVEEQNKLISRFKPLIHSRLGSFIFIGGQELYYEFIKDRFKDNSIMSSIFDNSIHISIGTPAQLRDIFKTYIQEIKEEYNDTLIENYANHLILNSNSIIRKFNSLLLNNVYRDENEGKFYINISDQKLYERDTVIVNCIEYVINNHIDAGDYDGAIRDFLIQQLYLLANKIRSKAIFRTLDEIYSYDEESYYGYLKNYQDEIRFNFENLKDELMKKNILSLEKEEDGSEYYIVGKEFIRYNVIDEDNMGRAEIIKIRFISSMKLIDLYSSYLTRNINFDQSKSKPELLKERIAVISNSDGDRIRPLRRIRQSALDVYFSLRDNVYTNISEDDLLAINESLRVEINYILRYIIDKLVLEVIESIVDKDKYSIKADRGIIELGNRRLCIRTCINGIYSHPEFRYKENYNDKDKMILLNMQTEISQGSKISRTYERLKLEMGDRLYNIESYNLEIDKDIEQIKMIIDENLAHLEGKIDIDHIVAT